MYFTLLISKYGHFTNILIYKFHLFLLTAIVAMHQLLLYTFLKQLDSCLSPQVAYISEDFHFQSGLKVVYFF